MVGVCFLGTEGMTIVSDVWNLRICDPHPRKLPWIPKMMGLGKGGLRRKIWPFLVSIRSISGVFELSFRRN